MWNYYTVQEQSAYSFDQSLNSKIEEGYFVKDVYVFAATSTTPMQFVAILHRFNEKDKD